MNKTKIFSMLFLIAAVAFYSCKKEKQIEKPNLSGQNVNFNRQISLENLPDFSKTYNQFDYKYTGFGKNRKYVAGTSWLPSSQFKELSSIFTANENIGKMIFYTTYEDISKEKNLNATNVSAISIITSKDNKLYHRLFVKNGNTYIEDNKYLLEVNYINSKHLNFVLNEVLDGKAKSWLCVSDKEFSFGVRSQRNEFSIRMAAYNIRWKKNNPRPQGYIKPGGGNNTPRPGCGSEGGCNYGLPYQACIDYGPGAQCYSSQCSQEIAKGVMIDSSTMMTSQINSAFDTDKHTKFRDSFLLYSPYGRDIVTNYYAISDFLYGHIDLALATECALALPDVNSCIDKLTDDNQITSVVLLTSALEDDFTDVMLSVRAKSSDPDFILVVDDVIDNLEYFSGQTVFDVRYFFDNN